MTLKIIHGDALECLSGLPDESVQCCVTSPPYWGLRDYGVKGQYGSEKTPEEYVAKMVATFREVRRVLAKDGTLWLNLGDTYAGGGNGAGGSFAKDGIRCALPGSDKNKATRHGSRGVVNGVKAKDLIGIPWMVAFALRTDGWYLRQDIIWHKPSPIPESVKDRCTKSHEYIFLLSKSPQYYFDADAIAEQCTESSIARLSQDIQSQSGSMRANGGTKTNGPMKAVGKVNGGKGFGKQNHDATGTGAQSRQFDRPIYDKRNKRSVWTVAAAGYAGAHFATFPPNLVEPCILAGSRKGETVLDPFSGTATVGESCQKWGRKFVGIELNPKYIELSKARFRQLLLV